MIEWSINSIDNTYLVRATRGKVALSITVGSEAYIPYAMKELEQSFLEREAQLMSEQMPLTEGIKHDERKLRYELLPPEALREIVHVLTKGAEKYESRNWEKGISYGRIYGALQRHLNAFWGGEDADPEWGIHHLAHAGCCLLFLLTYELRNIPELDDRPKEVKPELNMKEADKINTEDLKAAAKYYDKIMEGIC